MSRGYVLGPAYRKKLLMGLRAVQIALIGFAIAQFFFLFLSGQPIIGAIIAAAFIGAAFMPIGGRVIDEWILVMFN